MRILYFSRAYGPHDHRFLSALAETEHEVHFMRLEPDANPLDGRPLPDRIHPVDWAGGRRPFAWYRLPALLSSLRIVLDRLQPDLLHAGPIQDVGLLAALSGFHPLLVMSWGFDLIEDAGRSPFMGFVTRQTLRRADAFTSDARVTCQKAVDFGMDPAHCVVFPWGVDLQRFSPGLPPRRKGRDFTLLCNRSWEPRYGVDVLARAFVLAARRMKNLHLTLLGGGSQEDHLRRIFLQGGAADRVRFGGRVHYDDQPDHYHQADLFISPSHVDGSSVSLMEALACGLPVLVSDIPANREWVQDGVNGWLFTDGDHRELADRIVALAQDRRRLTAAGREGRRTAETRADWPANFQRLLGAYRLAGEVSRGR